MNRDIQLLRDVIVKLVPLLTGKGLKVTQRGTQAYVQANPKTNKPEVVNIPSIPDNASDDFIAAVSGFVDHEVAHVLFTDWRYYGGDGVKLDKLSPEGRALTSTHNIIEDTMIEREIIKTFPGSEMNLDRLHRHFLAKITTPALVSAKGNENAEFSYLVVPMMRALSGQEIFKEFMDQNGYWKHPMIENLLMALSDDALELIKKARTTQETLEVAQEVHDILFNNKKKDGSSVTPPPAKKSKSQDKPEQQAGQGNGDGERKHEEDGEAGDSEDASSKASDASDDDDADEEQSGNGGGSNDEESEDESDDESGGAGPSEDDAGEDSQGSSDEESDGEGSDEEQSGDSGDDDSEEEGDEADDVKSEDGASEEEADEAGEDDGEAEEADDGDGEADGEDTGFEDEQEDYEDHDGNNDSSDQTSQNGGGVGGDAGKSMFDLDPSQFKPLDLSSAIANEIQQMAQKAVGESKYSVFTKDEDQIKTLDVPDSVVRDGWIPKLDDAVMSMVGPMQKDIERLMAAQSLSVRTAGHKSGRLHSASLYRVMQGDPRVFQRKEEHRSKDTAVMLLVDCSGSMIGARIVTAMQAAYALAQTLERVNIPSEILGFTTGSMSSSARQQAYEEYQKHGVSFSRDSHTIVMPIFKSFNERLNSTVKKRIAYQLNVQSGMNTNTDGESLEYAAMRLIPRREKRKVMLVMSDGQPVGTGSGPHLKETVNNLTKIGVETVGIGIQSDAVKHFYPRYLTLNNVADLPSAVMGELKRILTN